MHRSLLIYAVLLLTSQQLPRTHTHTYSYTYTQTQTQIHRHKHRHRYRQTPIQTQTQTDTDRHRHRQPQPPPPPHRLSLSHTHTHTNTHTHAAGFPVGARAFLWSFCSRPECSLPVPLFFFSLQSSSSPFIFEGNWSLQVHRSVQFFPLSISLSRSLSHTHWHNLCLMGLRPCSPLIMDTHARPQLTPGAVVVAADGLTRVAEVCVACCNKDNPSDLVFLLTH